MFSYFPSTTIFILIIAIQLYFFFGYLRKSLCTKQMWNSANGWQFYLVVLLLYHRTKLIFMGNKIKNLPILEVPYNLEYAALLNQTVYQLTSLKAIVRMCNEKAEINFHS